MSGRSVLSKSENLLIEANSTLNNNKKKLNLIVNFSQYSNDLKIFKDKKNLQGLKFMFFGQH